VSHSKPLCPLTADPDDQEVLNPAHFLIGDSMLAPPESQPQPRSFAEQFLIRNKALSSADSDLGALTRSPRFIDCNLRTHLALISPYYIPMTHIRASLSSPQSGGPGQARMSHARSSIGWRQVQSTACPDSLRATRSGIWNLNKFNALNLLFCVCLCLGTSLTMTPR